ncbi:MAG: ATP-grasp domain-containing protein [Magnetococcales bacterium]|nr:ATP-grasp domain-containing protein [Magnetococcales bacterium]
MARPIFALFANHDSPQVEAAREAFVQEGAEPKVFDIRLGGKDNHPTITMGNGHASWQGVDFSDIQGVYIRCTAPNTVPALPPVINAASHAEMRASFLREQEYTASVMAFFDYLVTLGKLVINPLTSGYIDHDTKAQLYHKLRENGFPAPNTLSTNDPEAVVSFLKTHGEAIVKPSMGIGSARAISLEDRQEFDAFRICPVMMQERIMGNTIRVHVVGDEMVLSLKIINEGGVDSRTATREFLPYEMSEEEKRRIVAATHFLGLRFAAWDVIADGEGGHVYLDCNPGPFIMWIGPENVNLVYRKLARYMMARTGTA